MSKAKENGVITTLRLQKKIIDAIDKERLKFSATRTSWIAQCAVEKLEKLGYEF